MKISKLIGIVILGLLICYYIPDYYRPEQQFISTTMSAFQYFKYCSIYCLRQYSFLLFFFF